MNIIIETDRLILRELSLNDTENLALILCDPESMKYYPKTFSMEDVKNWISWNIDNYKKYGFGLWAVILKEENRFIGDCGITMQNIEGKLLPEIGYHIITQYRQKGYASEAAKECITFAFRQKRINTVISYMKYDNIPSRRVAEKNGMTFVKSFSKEIYGKLINEVVYKKERDI